MANKSAQDLGTRVHRKWEPKCTMTEQIKLDYFKNQKLASCFLLYSFFQRDL